MTPDDELEEEEAPPEEGSIGGDDDDGESRPGLPLLLAGEEEPPRDPARGLEKNQYAESTRRPVSRMSPPPPA